VNSGKYVQDEEIERIRSNDQFYQAFYQAIKICYGNHMSVYCMYEY